MGNTNKYLIYLIILLSFCFLFCNCAPTRQAYRNDIPVLLQDELTRPYVKLGRIMVTREVSMSDYSITPDIKAWGLEAVQQEAVKMGADAVILHEVVGHTTTHGIIPSTEFVSSGFAIKFK